MRHVVLRAAGGSVENPIPRTSFRWVGRFDIVHAHQLRTASTSALALACRAAGKPLVVTDLGGGGRSLMNPLRLYRLVRRFVMISRFSLRLLPASVQDRASVVLGGIDPERYPMSGAPRKRQAVLVARILPHKGANYLIEAAGKDIPVVIAGRVGDAGYYERLRRMAEGTQVRFLIDPTDEQVRELYATSAVTVSASVYRDLDGNSWPMSELLGLTLLESMSSGTPVVCTDVGGMPEYVADGTTGFIVPPNEPQAMRVAMLRLLDDTALNRQMGVAGREHIGKFTWPALAGQVMVIYRSLLGL
jgi:glycosyltransferase involved in cell wall biosynthesis